MKEKEREGHKTTSKTRLGLEGMSGKHATCGPMLYNKQLKQHINNLGIGANQNNSTTNTPNAKPITIHRDLLSVKPIKLDRIDPNQGQTSHKNTKSTSQVLHKYPNLI